MNGLQGTKRGGRGGLIASAVATALWFLAPGAQAAQAVVFETVRLTNGPPTTVYLVQAPRETDSKRPVVLTLGALKPDELPDWSTNLIAHGFLVVAFAAEYPSDPDPARRPVWLHFDPRFANSYVLGGLRTPKDTGRVIDYLTSRLDVDAERIGWLGSSTTGIFGLAAATREPRIKAIVAFVATGAYEKWFETWKPNGLWQSDASGLWPETVALLPEADPIRRATNLFPCATLLVNGGEDKVVDVSSARAFVEAARPAYVSDPDRLRLVVYEGMGHNLPRDILQLYTEHWFGKYLGPSPGSPNAAARPKTLGESTRLTALTRTSHEVLIGAAEPSGQAVDGEALQSWMPRLEDYTLMWWADGPPSYLTSSQPPASETLCFQSGTWGMAFDTRRMRLLRFGTFLQPMPLSEGTQRGRHALEGLPAAAWDCAINAGGKRLTCTGHGTPKDEFFQPVRVVESGHFFQRVVIEDLKFSDGDGQVFDGSGRLEIFAWPDRLAFRFSVEPKEGRFQGNLELRAGDEQVNVSARSEVWLRLNPKRPGIPVRLEAEAALQTEVNEALDCYTIALPEKPWSNAKGTYYPEEQLDRLDRWQLRLHNDSDQEATAHLMFTQRNHLPITGFTPLLCDEQGAPTGIPVQISKNWHRRPEKGTLPNEGPWFHGCTFLRLPPHSHREFKFSMIYARYGGAFAASHAQLSLIGWGHNQFWDEVAIGSFGESICFEPGRVQRRCFIDDIRPLLTLPEAAEAKPYGWAGNCGGGDFLLWQDPKGRYQPFRATRTDYRAYGPCLTEVAYSEETCGGELREQVTVSVPRSNDYLRTFIYLRCDVDRPIAWQRLAFFQLGADFYNETPSRQVAIGYREDLREEWQPKQAKDQFDRQGLPLSGQDPWVSIHGLESAAVKPGAAAASRGLIVRQWRARLGGKPTPLPYVSSRCTEWGKDNHRTVLELSPSPGLSELHPGDFVEAELELVVFPATAAAYYGPDAEFRAALAANADTWRLVQREAGGNSIQAEPRRGSLIRSYPLRVGVDSAQTAEVELVGGLGYVPATFTGLSSPRGYALWMDGERVDQSVHGNDFWQTDYDPANRRWQITFNIPINSHGQNGRFKILRFARETDP